MRKIMLAALAGCICGFCFIVGVISLAGCGPNWYKLDALVIVNPVSKERFSIPLAFDKGQDHGPVIVLTENTAQEMKQRIESCSNKRATYCVTAYAGQVYAIAYTDKNGTQYGVMFPYTDPTGDMGNGYLFDSTTATLLLNDQSTEKTSLLFEFPYFLLDEQHQNPAMVIDEGSLYWTDFSMQDFVEFYQAVAKPQIEKGFVSIETTENQITLYGLHVVEDWNTLVIQFEPVGAQYQLSIHLAEGTPKT